MPMTDEALYEGLCRFITPERRATFDRVATDRTRHVTVLLEDIYQQHNASAVLRSCDLLGVQDVHVIERVNTFAPNPDVALGSAKWLDIHRARGEDATAKTVQRLRDRGYRIVVTSPHARSRTPHDIDIDAPLAICFGTELTGASNELLQAADDHLRIPMYGFTESYNISVSVAITLFTITERMRRANERWRLGAQEQLGLKLEWARRSVRDADLIEQRLRTEHGERAR